MGQQLSYNFCLAKVLPDCWATLSTVIEHYNKLQNVQQIPKLEKKMVYKIQFQKVDHNIHVGHTTKFHMWKVQTGNYTDF